MKRYVSISLPKSLIDEVKEILRNEQRGYTSIAEFVKDAIRRKVDEMKAEPAESGNSIISASVSEQQEVKA